MHRYIRGLMLAAAAGVVWGCGDDPLAEGAGDKKKAAAAFVRLYYEYPLTPAGTSAAAQLDSLSDLITRRGYDADIGRAQMFFGAQRWEEAKAAFTEVRPHVSGDNRELVDLRIAECDYHLGNYTAARNRLQPYTVRASRLAEARFFSLGAIRGLGDHEQYVTLANALVADFPESFWAEELGRRTAARGPESLWTDLTERQSGRAG